MFKAIKPFVRRRQVLLKSHMERFVECEETINLPSGSALSPACLRPRMLNVECPTADRTSSATSSARGRLEKTMHLKRLHYHNKQSSESQNLLNSNIFKTCGQFSSNVCPLSDACACPYCPHSPRGSSKTSGWPSKTYFCAYPLRRPEAGSHY